MIVAIGSDHAGFSLKQHLRSIIGNLGHQVLDMGAYDETPSDYPDYAAAVSREVVASKAERGIVVCGSGVGACIAANKLHGIRAGLCHDTYSAHQGVEHDDMNVLVLGARIVGQELAREIVLAFLSAQYTGEERHKRRLAKVLRLEESGA